MQMSMSKSKLLRLGLTVAAILLVGWGMWHCQGHSRLLDIRWVDGRDVATFDRGGPMFHTHEIVSWAFDRVSFSRRAALDDRTAIFPGALVDVTVWCAVLIATGCVVWQWAAYGRQWSLRTVFGIFFVVAILLSWWRTECNIAAAQVPAKYADVFIVLSEAPMLTLLRSPWYVCVPVLFGLGCGMYWAGWIGGSIAAKIIKGIHHVAMSKLR
jgi:hypothetical protein